MVIRPMLATAGPMPEGPAWAYEFKWDGIRVIAEVTDADGTRLFARSGAEVTAAYPELSGLATGLSDAVFDGEVVAALAGGRPSFERLAERMHVRDPRRARALAATAPVTYFIFDLLRLDHVDLCARPYTARRTLLEQLDLGVGCWHVSPSFDDGPATLAASIEHELEGVMAKRRSAAYHPGRRSPDWVKVKHVTSAELVVGGWRPGARPLGALLVGVPRPDGRLVYRGRVGGGLTERGADDLLRRLAPLAQPASPFAGELPRDDARGAVWVAPRLVVEVAYGNRTPDGRLRFPRFKRLRPDRDPDDVTETDVTETDVTGNESDETGG